jgi:hypothetical protein
VWKSISILLDWVIYKRNNKLEIENGLLYTTIQELNKKMDDMKQELKQINFISKSSNKKNKMMGNELQVM